MFPRLPVAWNFQVRNERIYFSCWVFSSFESRVKEPSISFWSCTGWGIKIVRNFYHVFKCFRHRTQQLCLHLLLTFISKWASSWEDLRCVLRRQGRPQHNSELEYICPWWPRGLSGWFSSHLPPGASLICWDRLNCYFFGVKSWL